MRAPPALATAVALLVLASCGNEAPSEGATSDASLDTSAKHDVAAADASPADAPPADSEGGDTSASRPVGCAANADCAALDDDNPCNGVAVCLVAEGRCALTAPVWCDTSGDGPCEQSQCDPKTGACSTVPANPGAPCEDGDPCTSADACKDGVCTAGVGSCACTADSDCAPYDDKCTGTHFCDKSVWPYTCKINAASVVSCPSKDVGPCKSFGCDPADGVCKAIALADQSPCDDGDPCTQGELCASGTCGKGADTCVCTQQADCAALEDGDLCNGVLYCDLKAGKCKVNPKTVVTCPDTGGSTCAKNTCNPSTGTCAVTPVKPGTACDDGDACTVGEICVAGQCGQGTNTCACKSDADCAAKGDGNPCNGQPFCNKQVGFCEENPAQAVVCPTAGDTPCLKNACLPSSLAGSCTLTAVERTLTFATGGGVRYEVRPPAMASAASPVCDDGDPCTLGERCGAGACGGGTFVCGCKSDADCAGAGDGDLCKGSYYCDQGASPATCKLNPATQVSCKSVDDTACVKNLCQPKSGQCAKTLVPDATACDDGDPCTESTLCVAGSCVGGAKTCACQTNADCEPVKGDGDLCNGVLYCDKSGKKPACKINPASVVTCPKGKDSACLANTCLPQTGACQMLPANEGKACDDGDGCTVSDSCKAGVCAGGADSCACSNDTDCAKLEDGNACNGTLYCDKTQTKPRCEVNPATKVLCPAVADTACAKNACVPLSGACTLTATELAEQTCDLNEGQLCRWEQRPKGEVGTTPSCDDGDPCTQGDLCGAGVCKSGTFTCFCKSDADCAGKTDGDLCKGAWYCDKSGKSPTCKPNPKLFKVCPSVGDTPCIKNTCQPTTGACVPTPLATGSACDDGEPCRTGTVCIDGACKGGVQTCACITHAECEAKHGDGDLCTGTWYCDKSGAKPKCALNKATVVTCVQDTGTPCAKKACNPATGICQATPANEGGPCNDGDICSKGDTCVVGLCKGATQTACDDGDACTFDTCDKLKGCLHEAKSCDDGNACTDEVCSKLSGQCVVDVGKLSGKPCDADGNPCTEGDTCDKGTCKAGQAVVCPQPKDPCATSQCVGLSATTHKCVVKAKPEGADCDDGSACMAGAACKAGQCKPGDQPRLGTIVIKAGGVGAEKATSVDARAVVGGVDGSLLVLGMALPQGPVRWRISAAGSVLDTATLGGPADTLNDLARLSDGALVAVGGRSVSGKQGTSDGLLLTLDAGGAKVVNTAVYGDSAEGQRDTLLRVDAQAGVGAALLGSREKGSLRHAGVGRTDATGKLLWLKWGAFQFTQVWPRDVVQRSDGGVLWLGRVDPGSANQRAVGLVALASNGTEQWRYVGETWAPGSDIWPRSAALRSDGSVVVAGYSLKAGKTWSDLRAVSKAGKLLWKQDAVAGRRLDRVATLPGGQLWVAGATPGASASPLHLQRLTGGLSGLWTTSNYAAFALPRGLHRGDVLTVVGAAQASAQAATQEAFITRLSPFGHASCGAVGACWGKAFAACDDGAPCTRDGCEGKSGCTHDAKAMDGGVCPIDGSGCATEASCAAGKCVPSANGKLFRRDHTPDAHGGGSGYALGVVPSGGYLVMNRSGTKERALTFGPDGAFSSVASAPPPSSKLHMHCGSSWLDVSLDVTGVQGAIVSAGRAAVLASGSVASGACKGKKGFIVSLIDAKGARLSERALGDGYNHIDFVERSVGQKAIALGYTSYHWEKHMTWLYTQVQPAAGVVSKPKAGPKTAKSNLVHPIHTRATAAADGGVWLLYRHGSGYRSGGLMKLDATLSVVKQGPTWEDKVTTTSQVALVRSASGLLFSGLEQKVTGSLYRASLVGVTTAGKVSFVTNLGGAPSSRLRSMASVADRVVTLTNRLVGVDWQVRMDARDGSDGSLRWRREFVVPAKSVSAHPRLLAPLASGGVAFMASVYDTTQSVHALFRTDAWGFASCAASGVCFDKSGTACDDTNPCTSDTCDPAKGCAHSALADGTSCGSGKTCAAGVCK